MDPRTVQYYDDHADDVFAQYSSGRSGVEKYFRLAFPAGSEILDIGAGSGRDLDILIREEYEAYGAEPSIRLRDLAIANIPRLAGRICAGALPDLAAQVNRKFDGILCSAVFQHITLQQQFDAAFDIRNLLKPNGRLLLSIPKDRPGIDASGRDERGRLFITLIPEELELLFERLGFQRIGKWEDTDNLGRPGFSWTTLLFDLRSDQQLRPIDQIEGVLNRDRKVATYKLALFRALCDIALTNYHLAEWRPDGSVGIPVRAIAERWIYYYWPLFEGSVKFIPQIRGESRTCEKPVAFRGLLENLIASYQSCGGLNRFTLDYRSDQLNAGIRETTKRLITRLIRTILEGPVIYAGGSLETGCLFGYDAERRHVIVDGAIWREFCLAGHWIKDALILRWAELTSKIAKGEIKPSEIIDLLLTVPIAERDVDAARAVYEALDSKVCVWSNILLQGRFEVDHVVPFSLWQNNELWNLLPAHPKVNHNKKDKLPEKRLLKQRMPVILDYWNIMHRAYPKRFEHETRRFTGVGGLDFLKTFNVMVEAVEVTWLQRGCLRWEP
jgi:SAM-dependent methyltransferase